MKEIVITGEQTNCVKKSLTGEDLKIKAYSGAGKTATLVEIANARPETSFLYLTFNKAASLDAKKRFPKNVQCSTIHSLAWQAVGKHHYGDRLERMNGFSLSKSMKLGSPRYFRNKPFLKGNFILSTIKRFCYTADSEITIWHTPYIDLKKVVDEDFIEAAQIDLVKYAKLVWNEMMNKNSNLPITHDFYLKLFAMMKPIIAQDVIMIDEAQDSNPLTLQIADNHKGQVIYVGDTYQSLYSWRGAVDAMDKIKAKHTCEITQSFRFGQTLANLANDILNEYHPTSGGYINIKGFDKVNTEIRKINGLPDAILCRTNRGVMEAVMENIKNHKVHISGGANPLIELFEGMDNLKNGKKTYHHDLKLFEDWGQLLDFTETDMGGDLKVVVKLAEMYGIHELISVLEQTHEKSENADITICTGHKSKGLEWSKVKLWNDFFEPNKETGLLTAGESCLLYVSATRAKNVLDITSCSVANPKMYKKMLGIELNS